MTKKPVHISASVLTFIRAFETNVRGVKRIRTRFQTGELTDIALLGGVGLIMEIYLS